ncbi:LysM peptidoglycan-binding domain-containing protein [Streptomyces sp. WMMC1477]|uniref:LysM peptidoglycan-binding domain-containing protein n=1 Tax=Streptomyces sp. WMMC1477 TaxID=3015155 RepID=UPI0022B6D4FD|nr:transglycosylase family protein [Streptomyces sp. WMMC1477]MCZ7430499.1 transglycosylase family protein [Streptomyces sp. WMMC1477]
MRRGIAARAGAVSLAVLAPVALLTLTAGPAKAADGGTWDRLAQCESGGNWRINTGNGYYGGLQFSASTWAAYGGTAYAATADTASRAQQIEIAGKVQAAQGWGAWPACSAKLGLYGSDPRPTRPAPPGQPASPAPEAGSHSGPDASARGSSVPERAPRPHADRGHSRANYTVEPGDTLSAIAAEHDTAWRRIHRDNAEVIGADPDVILPGQRLHV